MGTITARIDAGPRTLAQEQQPHALQWQIAVPIFRNTVILKQLGLAIGLPFGLLMLILLILGRGQQDTWYALGLIALLLVSTVLLVLLLYHGRYEVQFTLDQKGALGCTTPRWAKRSRAVNTATVVLGALSGKPAVMGAGVLAQQGQQVFLQWSHIETVTLHPKSSTILLRSGWMQPLALFCTASNYPAVQQFVKTHIKPGCRTKP